MVIDLAAALPGVQLVDGPTRRPGILLYDIPGTHSSYGAGTIVTTAAGMGAATCAQSRLQLLNGFVDVRENVEEVMRFIVMDKSPDGT